jgi:hypothetical protein
VADPVPAAAPAAAVAIPAPAAAPPVPAAPAASAAPAPAAPTQPVATPAPAPAVEPAKPAAEPVVAEVKPPTVLGVEPPKPAEVKPAEPPKPAEGEKKPEAVETKDKDGPSEKAPPPVYEAWKFPENTTVKPEIISEFNGLLGEFEGTTKADHAAMQALGQKLVDFHAARINDMNKAIVTAIQDQHKQMTKEYYDAFAADPEIGGNRMDTTVEAARRFINDYGGSVSQQAELRDLMNKTGLGNHPALIRLMANAGLARREGRQLAAVKPAGTPKSKTATLYGSKAG